MNYSKHPFIILLFIAFSLIGCDSQPKQSSRSGVAGNDYIEQPLNASSKVYENALKTSNLFIKKWKEKDFHFIEKHLVSSEVIDVLNAKKLLEIDQSVTKIFGELKEYKPMQWAFESKKAKRNYFLFSIKIVEHEKHMANYLFQFLLDGDYSKVIGFYVRETPKQRAPGQIHNLKQ